MVVEDDRALLELLIDYFESEHVEIVAVERAEQALERLRKDERLPDLMLVDLRMPEVTGEELIHRVRAEPRWAGIPIVVMSGDLARLEFGGHEGLPVLAKPFSIDELNELLSRYMAAFAAESSP
jgi:CheY-like chemotaxis protein